MPACDGVMTIGCDRVNTVVVMGMGAWWPERMLQEKPASSLEEQYGNVQQTDYGVRVGNHMPGITGSSTRAEAGGGKEAPRCCQRSIYWYKYPQISMQI